MAAPTALFQTKQVKGLISFAQVSFTGAETTALVAASTGKRIHVLGLVWTHASAGTIIISSAADVIFTGLAMAGIEWLPTPGPVPRDWVNYLQTNVGEALNATSTSNSKVTVWYTVE